MGATLNEDTKQTLQPKRAKMGQKTDQQTKPRTLSPGFVRDCALDPPLLDALKSSSEWATNGPENGKNKQVLQTGSKPSANICLEGVRGWRDPFRMAVLITDHNSTCYKEVPC